MNYESFVLDNGLKVIVHEDRSTRVAVLNLLYNVGSKDESPDKTGFAHLFEHLMFGGSKNISDFDGPLQKVGGENNAFTNTDYTNYYITVPSANLETAFWLESDRMLSLSFDPKVLEVQRKVVIEEFKQRYLNQPYGDAWLKLRPVAYQHHPYRWATIGKEVSHIENATMDDVKAFFKKFYIPNNATLCVAGDVDPRIVRELCKKWFGPIPAGETYHRNLPAEPTQKSARTIEVTGDVPMNAIYKVYHMCDRLSADYHPTDLLSDILGRGKSSRLYHSLVKESQLMNKVYAHVSGSVENGLLVINGRLSEGVAFEAVDEVIENEIRALIEHGLKPDELEKVKAQAESSHLFGEMEVLNRAMSLAYFANLGDTSLVNQEIDKINAVDSAEVTDIASKILRPENCTTLYYKRKS